MTTPPFPHDLATQNDVLRRFVKKVAVESTDDRLGDEADELILLYGDPDAPKLPMGIINAAADIDRAREAHRTGDVVSLDEFNRTINL